MIRVKENRKSLKGLQGCYAYSHVNEYGEPTDLYVVAGTTQTMKGLFVQ